MAAVRLLKRAALRHTRIKYIVAITSFHLGVLKAKCKVLAQFSKLLIKE